ncbi:hypothetical protein C4097_06805 [Clostridioides difficile]|nr:hypothetical protein [Clostridioides difficile]
MKIKDIIVPDIDYQTEVKKCKTMEDAVKKNGLMQKIYLYKSIHILLIIPTSNFFVEDIFSIDIIQLNPSLYLNFYLHSYFI